MTLFPFKGAGLPLVFLTSGFVIEVGPYETVAYEKLNELYFAIAYAVAIRRSRLSGSELRFLRGQLHMTQAELGHLWGKSAQAVAKWEKGIVLVPVAEGRLVRMAWLSRHARRQLIDLVETMIAGPTVDDRGPYVFSFNDGVWVEDVESRRVAQASIERLALSETRIVIERAKSSAVTGAGDVAPVLGPIQGIQPERAEGTT